MNFKDFMKFCSLSVYYSLKWTVTEKFHRVGKIGVCSFAPRIEFWEFSCILIVKSRARGGLVCAEPLEHPFDHLNIKGVNNQRVNHPDKKKNFDETVGKELEL